MWRCDQNLSGERRLLSDGCYSLDDGDLLDRRLHHLAAAFHCEQTFFWQSVVRQRITIWRTACV
jgi:hypothetical protein